MSAIEPAKDGADAEVPPTPKKRNSRAFAAKVKAEDGTVISVAPALVLQAPRRCYK
jgi:hypothetical protein